jgi:hypothetical protein
MGKIRVSALGDQDAEKKQKEEAAKRRLAKKVAKGEVAADTVVSEKKPSSAKATEGKEIKASKKIDTVEKKEEAKKVTKKSEGTPKKKVLRIRGKRYKNLRTLVDPRKIYPLAEGLTLVKQTSTTKFAGTVEAHFNLSRTVKVKNIDGLKAERKTPLAHAKLGKTTDTEAVLKTKLEQITKALGQPNIKKVVINASMGPGIKVSL